MGLPSILGLTNLGCVRCFSVTDILKALKDLKVKLDLTESDVRMAAGSGTADEDGGSDRIKSVGTHTVDIQCGANNWAPISVEVVAA